MAHRAGEYTWFGYATMKGTFAISLLKPIEVGTATKVMLRTDEPMEEFLGCATVRSKPVAIFSLDQLLGPIPAKLEEGAQVMIVHHEDTPVGYLVGPEFGSVAPGTGKLVSLPATAFPGGKYPRGLSKALIVEGNIVLTIDLENLRTEKELAFARQAAKTE